MTLHVGNFLLYHIYFSRKLNLAQMTHSMMVVPSVPAVFGCIVEKLTLMNANNFGKLISMHH